VKKVVVKILQGSVVT